MRGATAADLADAVKRAISIHAPREGSDEGARPQAAGCTSISIHAPREGSDPRKPLSIPCTTGYFYPRSP